MNATKEGLWKSTFCVGSPELWKNLRCRADNILFQSRYLPLVFLFTIGYPLAEPVAIPSFKALEASTKPLGLLPLLCSCGTCIIQDPGYPTSGPSVITPYPRPTRQSRSFSLPNVFPSTCPLARCPLPPGGVFDSRSSNSRRFAEESSKRYRDRTVGLLPFHGM